MRSISIRTIVLIISLWLIGCKEAPESSSNAASRELIVFAAASTSDAMRKAADLYESQTGISVRLSVGSSSNLARQIEADAPADVFISADQQWMDYVQTAGWIKPHTRTDLLANQLVLIAPSDRVFQANASRLFDFREKLPQVERIAVGDPAHVPAGRYAQQALESLDWWEAVKEILLPMQDVRAALRLVELGEADAGIVYATDAAASKRVTVVLTFPADSHDPVRYPIALCRNALEDASEFIEFLRDDEMKRIFEEAGFRVLAESDVVVEQDDADA